MTHIRVFANQNHNETPPITMTKRQETTSVGRNVEKREPLSSVGENVNWSSQSEEHYGSFIKTKKKHYYIIQNVTTEYLSEENENTNSKRHMYSSVYCSIIFNTNIWK